MSKLTYVDINKLKVGDVVGYCYYVTYSWGKSFRYPIVYKKTITRITPKRTKFVLDNKDELKDSQARYLVEWNDEAVRQSSIAKNFKEIQNIEYELEMARRKNKHIIAEKFTDEELVEHLKYMKSIKDKYLSVH